MIIHVITQFFHPFFTSLPLSCILPLYAFLSILFSFSLSIPSYSPYHSPHIFISFPPSVSPRYLRILSFPHAFLYLHRSIPICRYPELTDFWLTAIGKKQIVTVEAFCVALSSHLCDGMHAHATRTCVHILPQIYVLSQTKLNIDS